MRKQKWKVQSNSFAGVGTVWRAARIIDPAQPEHSGNLEVYGEWCEDRDAVEETVRKLNEETSGELSETFRVCVCPICGTKFVPTSEWHWTHGKRKFCRYHCYLQRGKLEKPKNYHEERKVRQFTLTGEIVATYANAGEAAHAVGYPKSTIRAACNRGQPLGTGYRWEYVGEETGTDEENVEATPEADS